MRKGPLIFLVIAVLLAGAAAYGAYLWIDAQADREAAQRVVLAPVVVAARDLHTGTRIKAEHLEVIKKPARTLPPGHFNNPDQLVGRVIRLPVLKGQMIFVARLAMEGKAGGMAAMVPEGFRAMAVKVDEVVGVAGFVQVGDRVDVMTTIAAGPFRVNPSTRVVLQDVPVLAVGSKLLTTDKDSKVKKAKPEKVKVVTLQVTPKQGERLALSAMAGKIILALRNLGDHKPIQTDGVLLASLGAGMPTPEGDPTPAAPEKLAAGDDEEAAAAPPLPAPVALKPGPAEPEEKKKTVEIIRGTKEGLKITSQPL